MNYDLENINSKYLNDIYSNEEDKKIVEMDLLQLLNIVDKWLDGEEKVDPDFCHYMAMMLVSLAKKLEPDGIFSV